MSNQLPQPSAIGDQFLPEHAQLDQQIEAGRAVLGDDPLLVSLRIANAIRQAVFGGRGPLGPRVLGEGK